MEFNAVWRLATGAVVLALALTGCTSIPADSGDTLDRVTGGTLLVGVSEHEPWTQVADDGTLHGIEIDLVEGFAESLGAGIEWRVAPESILADEVAGKELDIMIGGLTTSSPWSSDVAFTRPYTEVVSDDGQPQKMVMGTRLGENAFLAALETHLAEAHGEIE